MRLPSTSPVTFAANGYPLKQTIVKPVHVTDAHWHTFTVKATGRLVELSIDSQVVGTCEVDILAGAVLFQTTGGDAELKGLESFRWGQDVEVFVPDARSYRDRNDLPDTAANDKDMLGKEQIAWLVEGIRTSTATWKIVSSDVPMSITTGSVQFGRDACANLGAEPTGFERELLRLLSELDRINPENVVFVTTDVHFAQTIAYDTDADGDGDRLVWHELVSGPLNAVRAVPRPLDPAANPTSLYADGGIFNFSYVGIERQADDKAHLIADVRGADGAPRPGSQLVLIPQ